jgi:ribosomal protein RSM22 (predicted rRNA methylase)
MINEKYSYLMVKKGTVASTSKPDAEEDDFTKPDEKSFFWPRVIRPVIRKHKHTIMDICNKEGEIERRIIAKSHGLEGGYIKSKRVRWGDLWYFERRVPNKFRKEGKHGKRLW